MADEKQDKKDEKKDERHPALGRDFSVEGNDQLGYVGVGHEYRTYANPTEKPYLAPGELAQIHQGGQLLDIEHDALKVNAAVNGGVVEPQVLALSMDQAKDREVTNVDVPDGVKTKTGATSKGQTVDAEGDKDDEGDEDKSEADKKKAPAGQTPAVVPPSGDTKK